MYSMYCSRKQNNIEMREWLSGGVSPCQGEGRGFESRLALKKEDMHCISSFLSAEAIRTKIFSLQITRVLKSFVRMTSTSLCEVWVRPSRLARLIFSRLCCGSCLTAAAGLCFPLLFALSFRFLRMVLLIQSEFFSRQGIAVKDLDGVR